MGEDGTEMTQNSTDHEDANMPPNEAQALTAPEKAPSVMVKSPNGDADVEAGRREPEFAGLTKEELEKYANDPFWVRLRWAMFILFWLAWLWMLIGAIVIIVLGPKCAPQPKLDWWQKEPVYSVLVRSFKDSNGDGVGDIAGVRSKLGYLSNIGAKTVWLSSVNDASDFRAIDSTYGTIEEFDALLKDIKDKEMHLVMDLDPNHSSDEHPWFQSSIGREANFSDFYVWADSQGRGPPNSRRTADGSSSAWHFNAGRGQWYYSDRGPAQPKLNYKSDGVKQEIEDVLKFWLDKGVNGFRLLNLLEPEDPTAASPDGAQDEIMDVLNRWRQLFDEYKAKDEQHRLLVADVAGDTETVMAFVGNGTDSADLVLNRLLSQRLLTPDDLTADTLREAVDEWRSNLPNDTWANWMLGGAGVSRVASRVGEEATDALNMLVLTLPGTPVTYYGEEIGMTDAARGALANRHRSPMQWSSGANAGFSDNGTTPWTPLNTNYEAVNVEAQAAAKHSRLNVYKKLTKLRLTSDSLSGGSYTELDAGNSTFAFMRLRDGSPGYVYLINTSDQTVDVKVTGDDRLPDEATVAVRSSQAVSEKTNPGTRVALKTVPLGPKEALLLSFVPKPPKED